MPDTRSTRKPEKLAKESLAAFFAVDMDDLTKRALQMEQTQAAKVNFYLVLVTAVIGALGAASTIVAIQPFILPVACLVLLVLHILGWAILVQDLNLATSSTIMYRRINRIRQWFLDEEPSIFPYLPFHPGDDLPPLYVRQMPLRGVETVLLFVNAVLAGLAAGLGWSLLDNNVFHFSFIIPFLGTLVQVGIGIIVFIILWSAEKEYSKWFMREKDRVQKQEEKLVHYPAEEMEQKYARFVLKSSAKMDKK